MYFSDSRMLQIIKKDKKLFWDYYVYWAFQIGLMRLKKEKNRPKRYASKDVCSCEDGNIMLAEAIKRGKPFMAGRFGSNELLFTKLGYFHENDYLSDFDLNTYKLNIENCGLFPLNIDTIQKFSNLMCLSLKETDLMCVWYNVLEDYFIEKYMPMNSNLTHRKILDFWNYDKPWTSALKGKKVLVIHPLADLIQEQYNRREKLFQNDAILPEFELRVFKAVQTIAGTRDERFSSWFHALDYMSNEVARIDFDVALIGCGAYGFPLAAKIKESGRIAIHVGGVTQILFGIIGTRWERDGEPKLMQHVNEFWVRPGIKDIPKNAKQVEGSCYW